MKYRVQLRRSLAEVKPEAEPIDDLVFEFTQGWLMDETDTSIYVGEYAMIPRDDKYPIEAPCWIASGDLVEPEQKESKNESTTDS